MIIAKINFLDIFTEFIFKFAGIRKNNFRKALRQFAKIKSAKLQVTKLFNIKADRMDAPKSHSKPQLKMVNLSVKQLLNSVKNNSIF